MSVKYNTNLEGIMIALEQGIERNNLTVQKWAEQGVYGLAEYHKGVRDGYQVALNALKTLEEGSEREE